MSDNLFYSVIAVLFLIGSGYAVHLVYQDVRQKSACERIDGVPVKTKDNIMVCVEAKREKDRK